MNRWKIKWNSGNLAILCSNCDKIIKEGRDFTEEEINAVKNSIALPSYYCDECTKKSKKTYDNL